MRSLFFFKKVGEFEIEIFQNFSTFFVTNLKILRIFAFINYKKIIDYGKIGFNKQHA